MAPRKYANCKYWETVRVKAANVYENNTQVPVVELVNVSGAKSDGTDIVYTDIDGNLIPRWILATASGYQAVYRDPVQLSTTGGTLVYRQWGDSALTVANDPVVWTGNYGGEDHELRYAMESTSGAEPDSAENYNGTVTGADRGQTAKIDSGMKFVTADTNNRVQNADAFNFEWNKPWTVSCYFKVTTDVAGDIITRQLNALPRTGIRIKYGVGKIEVWIVSNNGAGQQIIDYFDKVFTVGQWYHLAVSYDKSGDAAGVSCYVDKVALTRTINTDALAGSILTTAPFCVGCRNAAGNWFNGEVDEVRIFKDVITSNGISGLYDNLNGYTTNESLVISGVNIFSRKSRVKLRISNSI